MDKPIVQAVPQISGSLQAVTNTVVTVDALRFFATVNLTTNITTVTATNFKTDTGTIVLPGTLPTITANSYYNVFINKNLQPASKVSLTTTALTISGTSFTPIPVNIVLVVYTFTAASTSTITQALTLPIQFNT